jgi:hypothetical protein
MPVYTSNRTIPEVFDLVRKTESQEEKVKALRAYDSKQMRWFIYNTYFVDWSGVKVPDYKPNHRPPEICNMSIKTSIARLDAAYQHSTKNPDLTRKLLDIVLHEVSADEAELLTNMIKGKKIKGVSKSVLKAAFPNFFPDEPKKET